MAKHRMYGYINESYYVVNETVPIIITDNIEYKQSALQKEISEEYNECKIDIYQYQGDLITENNIDRVAFMKEFLINEKVLEIGLLNDDYIVSVEYDLFNKDGKMIRSGANSIKAKFSTAIIQNEVDEINALSYRKGMIFNGRIEIPVPLVSKYGIMKPTTQHPYTLKIKTIKILTTIGEFKYINEENTQVDGIYNHKHLHYHICEQPNSFYHNNFSSVFITNAQVGTTIIEETIVPKELQIPPKFTEIVLCEIPCKGMEYTIKMNTNLDMIILNTEVLFDNFNVVYDEKDILSILEINNKPCEDGSEEPDEGDETDTPPKEDEPTLPPIDNNEEDGSGNDNELGENGELEKE